MGCSFIFCLHNHQPVGNFDHIFDWAFTSCYEKIIDILMEYPEFKFSVHHSGPLLEWIEGNSPGYFDKLRQMVERKQIEIIGGGFYEPIFSIISESDIHGQLEIMQNYCSEKFGVVPGGFWTAERVWDPEIPRFVSDFNLNYTILDDNHFRYAGVSDDDLYGYFITERLNHPLNVFPIDKFLRYSIPFRQPEETVNYFREKTDRLGNAAFIYGDDGEKFGLWPGTFKWVYEEKWLVRFVETILKNDWINLEFPSSYIAKNHPGGRVYLTQGSYFELSEWALPPESALKLMNIHREIEEWGRGDDFYPFLKGGVWNNFLNKYPESNSINKRTLLLSKEIDLFEKDTGKKCTEEKINLYKGECNCAYWHGLFGGIYLNNLRNALHEHVLKAEVGLLNRKKEPPCLVQMDFWNEGEEQVLYRGKTNSAVVVPYLGGTISELGVYKSSINIMNVMARRPEAYHEELRMLDENAEGPDNGDVKSIHDITVVKEKGLKKYLVYDNSRRYSFKDLFSRSLPSADDIMYGNAEIIDGGSSFYDVTTNNEKTCSVDLSRKFQIDDKDIKLKKIFSFPEELTGVRAEYSLSGCKGLYFGIELNINLLSEKDDKRFFRIDGVEKSDSYLNSSGTNNNISNFSIFDQYNNLEVKIESSLSAILVRYPIYTVSQSDNGFEKNFQGSSMILFYYVEKDITELEVVLSVV